MTMGFAEQMNTLYSLQLSNNNYYDKNSYNYLKYYDLIFSLHFV